GVVTAASDLPMEPGQTVRLVVGEATSERVTLRLQADGGPGGGALAARATPAGALAAAGLPPAAAGALLTALADAGALPGDEAGMAALASRAAAAGVTTPAGAAAFARLAAAGLPTTPASVAGLAQLMEGAPIGRALATLLDGAAATAAKGSGTPPAAPLPVPPGAPLTAATQGAPAPAGSPSFAGSSAPSSTWTATGTSPGASSAAGGSAAAAAASVPAPATAPATAPANPATPLPAVVAALADLAEAVGRDATGGDATALRRAVAELGAGLEARLAAGDAPDAPPLRALLHAVGAHPAADAALARAAAGLADGLAAQGLAGATIPPPGAAAPDPSSPGAYLQLPLPGGGTAELRVAPDGGEGGGVGGDRPRRLAFLLHLSALGPVMIDATASRGAVDATIAVGTDDARAFLAPLAGELAGALRRAVPAASVSVERRTGPAPERLLAPPPASGLDLSA
ncbi:MAG: hypothetical protein AB7O53_16685, partial [Thermoleophilia bacterium]